MATAFPVPATKAFNNSQPLLTTRSPAASTRTVTVAPETATAPPSAQATSMNGFEQFSLTPLTAGDIIDRAIRLYRQHFLVFLRIVLVPSLIAYAGGILWALGVRNFSVERGDQRVLLTLAMMGGGGLLWLTGKALFLMLLGGASRGLVWHFFDGTPLSARATFAAVRERWAGLLGATILISVLLLMMVMLAYTVVSFALLFYVFMAVWLLSSLPPWLQAVLHVLFGLTATGAVIVLLLFVYARVVCVPQALMVEGKGVFDALTRSFQLAGRELKRIAALVLFQLCVATSVYWLLMIPLGWYGYWYGLDMSWFGTNTPIWFNIAQQTLAQLGEILIAPIVLLGFTLLYLDTRVRKEGFDIELLANRVFPATPPVIAQPVTPSGIAWTDPPPQTGSPERSTATPLAAPVHEVTQPVALRDQHSAVTAPSEPLLPETAVTIPLTQPAEFAELVPLPATVADPAVQTVPLHYEPSSIGVEPTHFCSECGALLETAAQFCTHCGTAIS